MTVLGKILVMVNLVFSLVVGALIIIVYVARTNLADAYDKTNKAYQQAVAKANTSDDAAEKAKAKAKTEIAKIQARLDEKDKALATALVSLKNAEAAREAAKVGAMADKCTAGAGELDVQ